MRQHVLRQTFVVSVRLLGSGYNALELCLPFPTLLILRLSKWKTGILVHCLLFFKLEYELFKLFSLINIIMFSKYFTRQFT